MRAESRTQQRAYTTRGAMRMPRLRERHFQTELERARARSHAWVATRRFARSATDGLGSPESYVVGLGGLLERIAAGSVAPRPCSRYMKRRQTTLEEVHESCADGAAELGRAERIANRTRSRRVPKSPAGATDSLVRGMHRLA